MTSAPIRLRKGDGLVGLGNTVERRNGNRSAQILSGVGESLSKCAHILPSNDGVADGTRTRDNRNHNPGLYQLSYSHQRTQILT